MPTSRNARGVDIVIYSQDGVRKHTIQVKSLSKRNPVPIGTSLDSLFADYLITCRNVLKSPEIFITSINEAMKSIKNVLRQKASNFDETQFDQDWKSFYSDERCSIAHGKGSKLIDIRTIAEHKKMIETVSDWAMEMIYYFIDKHKS